MKLKIPILILQLSLLLWGCAEKDPTFSAIPKGPFFGITPKADPQLLAPDFIASPLEEFNGTFNPEGTEFYYTSVIQEGFSKGLIGYTELQEDGSWSAPTVAGFSGQFDDYDPAFSVDGSRLYFSSRRPVHDSLPEFKSNIWFLERENDGWSAPKPLVFTERDDYYSSLTRDGTIYFNTWSTGNLLRAVPEGERYRIEELDTVVNQNYDQGDPFISPDEDYLIFRGYGEDRLGRGDLYICFNIEGKWTSPENLGAPINSKAHEMCPFVTPDGKLFIFASGRLQEHFNTAPLQPLDGVKQKFRSADNGELNIFYMNTDFIERLREKYLP